MTWGLVSARFQEDCPANAPNLSWALRALTGYDVRAVR